MPRTKMSREMREQALRARNWICPFCRQGVTTSDSHSFTVKAATTHEVCSACGAGYNRIYRLVAVKGGK